MSVRSDRSQLKRRSDHSATAWLERSSSYSAYAPSDLDSTGYVRLLFRSRAPGRELWHMRLSRSAGSQRCEAAPSEPVGTSK